MAYVSYIHMYCEVIMAAYREEFGCGGGIFTSSSFWETDISYFHRKLGGMKWKFTMEKQM